MKFMEERPAKLLNLVNAKTVKGEVRGYLTGILYLFPYKSFGFNLCPNAENADCSEPCLNTAGRGGMNHAQESRLRKTWLFHNEREWFVKRLVVEIEALERKARREGLTPCVRLNGTSDINWEEIRFEGRSLMERFSLIQFYDYTKLPRIPQNRNYHLTFSYSTAPEFRRSVQKAKRLGMNMAVVFRQQIPDKFLGLPVVDGDKNDLRFLDGEGVVVGLKAKGKANKSDSNLIVTDQLNLAI